MTQPDDITETSSIVITCFQLVVGKFLNWVWLKAFAQINFTTSSAAFLKISEHKVFVHKFLG